MANDHDYTGNGVELNQDCDDVFAEDAIRRALHYGIPYSIYRDAFISADGDRSGEECSNIIAALIRAVRWAAHNHEWVKRAESDEGFVLEDESDEETEGDEVVH